MTELADVIVAVASTFSEDQGGQVHAKSLQEYARLKYGGVWAVVVSEYKSAVNESFHWRVPAVKMRRQFAHCTMNVGYWTYSLVKVR